MAIKNLPGWQWHYPKGAPRYATDPRGNRYTQRDIQSLQHGEVYEKRVPKEQRKRYVRKVGKNLRHGPFHSIQEIRDYKQIGKDKSVWIQVHGQMVRRKKRKSPTPKSNTWRTVGGLTDVDVLDDALGMVEHGLHDTTPAIAAYTTRLQENISDFTEINEFFLYERQ